MQAGRSIDKSGFQGYGTGWADWKGDETDRMAEGLEGEAGKKIGRSDWQGKGTRHGRAFMWRGQATCEQIGGGDWLAGWDNGRAG